MGTWRPIAFLGLALLLAGCVAPTTQMAPIDEALAAQEAEKQRELVVKQSLDSEFRLSSIAHRLMTRSADLCGERVKPILGMSFSNLEAYHPDYRDVARRLYDLDDRLRIMWVLPGSAAEAAALAPGDRLVSVGDWRVPAGKGADKALLERIGKVTKIGEPLSLTVTRAGKLHTVRIVPSKTCDYDVRLDNQDIVNAFADGDSIAVTGGMMRFVENDIELATVVAHEIAHNAMGHVDAKRVNVLAGAGIGFILDILAAGAGVNTQGGFSKLGAQAGGLAYSVEFEAEADYVGLYVMAKAGYDVSGAPSFWRRMAVIHPEAIQTNHSATHPPTPHRFVAMENAVKEIRGKLAGGLPLTPEMKVEPAARLVEPARRTPNERD